MYGKRTNRCSAPCSTARRALLDDDVAAAVQRFAATVAGQAGSEDAPAVGVPVDQGPALGRLEPAVTPVDDAHDRREERPPLRGQVVAGRGCFQYTQIAERPE